MQRLFQTLVNSMQMNCMIDAGVCVEEEYLRILGAGVKVVCVR